MAVAMHDKLVEALAPADLRVIDESHMHAGPKHETHFKVIVVSKAFEGQNRVKRHRHVNSVLADELAGSVHALSIFAYTPAQWTDKGEVIPESPPCRGGSKRKKKA